MQHYKECIWNIRVLLCSRTFLSYGPIFTLCLCNVFKNTSYNKGAKIAHIIITNQACYICHRVPRVSHFMHCEIKPKFPFVLGTRSCDATSDMIVCYCTWHSLVSVLYRLHKKAVMSVSCLAWELGVNVLEVIYVVWRHSQMLVQEVLHF